MNNATLEHTTPIAARDSPPRRGVWVADRDHQSAPRGRMMQDLFTPQFVEGFREGFERYGMPLDRLDGCHIDGWFYIRPVPAGAPDNGKPAPPAAILKIAARLVPELRRRRRTAQATIAEARWLADADAWGIERERWEARIASSLTVDLPHLDDHELLTHLGEAESVAAGLLRRHFALVGMSVGVGRLVVACRRWGVEPAEVVAGLRGSSPSSAASLAGLVALATIVGDRTPANIGELRSLSAEAATLVDDHMTRYGWRPLSSDIAATTLAEHPDLMVDLVRAGTTQTRETGSAGGFAALRVRVPAPDRAAFDRLVDDAERCYCALDDNAGITASGLGTLRRVVLEIGRRAFERDAVTAIDDVFDCTMAEAAMLAAGGSPVTLQEFADRRARRAIATEHPPLSVIGGTPTPPPDSSVFPGALGDLAAAADAYLTLKFTAPDRMERLDPAGSLVVEGEPPVIGIAVVAGTVAGRVIVSRDPADAMARIEPGDILVCPYTTAAHNAVFPMLGGIVTQFGGPLGHTAVMAREFGLPAMVDAGALPVHLDERPGELSIERRP